MLVLTLAKTDLATFLSAVAEDRRLVGPVSDRAGTTFDEIADPTTICLDYRNSGLSPKGVVFPQRETLLVFDAEGGTEHRPEAPETVLFGVRPCDARAVSLLDKVFTWEGTEDPYYLDRRRRTTIVALACNEPGAACFCTSVGGDPADETGADVLAVDLGDKMLLRAITERGEELLKTAGVGSDASEADIQAAVKAADAARERLPKTPIPTDLDGLRAIFEDELWAQEAMTCLGCGACTYACPTCHCFDITDEAKHGAGERVRSWDTCAFPLFTLHGSGHNPRPAKDARVRQRVLHKFLYCPENFDDIFCVGCGRCVTHCPTGIDIRRILARVKQRVSTA